MRTLGFKIPVDYFNHNGAMTRARRQVRTRTKRECTNGTFVVDFKGPFAPSKDGAYTSLIGFKHPSSGYVHEVYLTNQLVATVCDAFDEFSYKINGMVNVCCSETAPKLSRSSVPRAALQLQGALTTGAPR